MSDGEEKMINGEEEREKQTGEGGRGWKVREETEERRLEQKRRKREEKRKDGKEKKRNKEEER